MLSPLDAEFLDGMIQLCEMKKTAATAYLSMSDATSDPMVVDMARGILSDAEGQQSMYKDRRGVVDTGELTNAANTSAVEVSASY
jgi:hypothetical protein